MRSTTLPLAVLCAVAALGSQRAVAEVIDATASGFSVAGSVVVEAPPAAVYQALTEIGSWWSSNHTFSGDAGNLTLDARAGGCWCEHLPGGGSVRHLVVVYADPPRQLRLQGGLGPLQGMAVMGTLTWTLAAVEKGTRIELSYVTVGFVPGGMQQLAEPVDGVLTEQLGRLAQYVGNRATPAGER
jgi:uncharacterized protein YndB with AHSA1/START domain